MQPSTQDDSKGKRNRAQNGTSDSEPTIQRRSMSADDIADAYAEVADSLARWQGIDRLFAGRYRRRQFGTAAGRVLDVACGTGRNFRHLQAATEVVGIDISDELLGHARDELTRLDLEGGVHLMDAQGLDFPDDSFDTVVSSFSTCTFPDPIAALQEMERVCTDDGEIRLLEHSRSDVGPLAWLQDRRADAQYEKNGCRADHEPLQTVERAGLAVEAVSTSLFGLVTAIDVRPRASVTDGERERATENRGRATHSTSDR